MNNPNFSPLDERAYLRAENEHYKSTLAPVNLSKFPTLFRGCTWTEEHWQFDAPSVVYFPLPLYGMNGVEELVEDYCINLSIGDKKPGAPTLNLGGLAKEFQWRGWSIRNMKYRKKAWHYVYRVEWSLGARGDIEFDYKQTYYDYGPPSTTLP